MEFPAMLKKTVKKKGTGAELARVERERAAELATLRRLKGQQVRIVEVSRAVTRAVRRADLARIDVARELVQGTEWGIYDRDGIRTVHADAEGAEGAAAELRGQLAVAR